MPERIAKLDDLCTRLTAALVEALPSALTKEELIARIRSQTLLLKTLTRGGNELFATEIRPMLASPRELTDENEDAFFSVAQKLSSFNIRIDTGMALSIYQALLERALHSGDRDRILKYLYWCGITLFYGSRRRDAEILSYFSEGAAYKPAYFELTNAESRQYIHRCMGNYVMILFGMGEPEKARRELTKTLAFFNQLLFDGIDADFPWVSYFLSCMNHYRQYFTKKLHSEPQSLTRGEIARIFKTSLMMSKLAHEGYGEKSAGATRYDMALWEAQLVAGQISIANFRENIMTAQALLPPGNFSNDALHANIMLPCYVMFYAQKLLPDDEAAAEIVAEQLARVTSYMKSLPPDINPGAISQYISLFLNGTSGMMPEHEHFEWVVKLTTYRHKPTFAHAITVSKLTRRIAEEYIRWYPAHFVGILGIESERQVAEKTDELLDIAENCGLCHDVGKLIFLQNQTMYTRALTEDELYAVEGHVSEGLFYFAESEKQEWLMACLHVIEGHHRYFNGKAGYPQSFDIGASPFKALIHTVTVADSLDSGTDDIGKVYADPKPLRTVIDEIVNGAGKRYSPFIAELLSDEALVADIRVILDAVRQDAYYAAYKFAEGEDIKESDERGRME